MNNLSTNNLSMTNLSYYLDYYKHYDDMEIIKTYIIENNLEAEAIKLMSQLSISQVNKLKNHIAHINNNIEYARSVLYNPIPDDVKIRLFEFINIYLNQRNLNPAEIEEVKLIFKKNKIVICPLPFMCYYRSIMGEFLTDNENKILKTIANNRIQFGANQ